MCKIYINACAVAVTIKWSVDLDSRISLQFVYFLHTCRLPNKHKHKCVISCHFQLSFDQSYYKHFNFQKEYKEMPIHSLLMFSFFMTNVLIVGTVRVIMIRFGFLQVRRVSIIMIFSRGHDTTRHIISTKNRPTYNGSTRGELFVIVDRRPNDGEWHQSSMYRAAYLPSSLLT